MRIFTTVFLFYTFIYGQENIDNQNQSLFLQAMRYERSGNILKSQDIYKRILSNQQSHQPS